MFSADCNAKAPVHQRQLYNRLGVPFNARLSDLKQAYRERLSSLEYTSIEERSRQDQNRHDALVEGIHQAYRVLSDPLRRMIYNRHGEASLSVLDRRVVDKVSSPLGLHTSLFVGSLIAVFVCVLCIVQASLIVAKLDEKVGSSWYAVLVPEFLLVVGAVLDLLVFSTTRLRQLCDVNTDCEDTTRSNNGTCGPCGTPQRNSEAFTKDLPCASSSAPAPQQEGSAGCCSSSTLDSRHVRTALVVVLYGVATGFYAHVLELHDASEADAQMPFVYAALGCLFLAEVGLLSLVAKHLSVCRVRVLFMINGLDDPPAACIAILVAHRWWSMAFRVVTAVLAVLKASGVLHQSWAVVHVPVYLWLLTGVASTVAKGYIRASKQFCTKRYCAMVIAADVGQTILIGAATVLGALRTDGTVSLSYGLCGAPIIFLLCVYLALACALFYYSASVVVEEPEEEDGQGPPTAGMPTRRSHSNSAAMNMPSVMGLAPSAPSVPPMPQRTDRSSPSTTQDDQGSTVCTESRRGDSSLITVHRTETTDSFVRRQGATATDPSMVMVPNSCGSYCAAMQDSGETSAHSDDEGSVPMVATNTRALAASGDCRSSSDPLDEGKGDVQAAAVPHSAGSSMYSAVMEIHSSDRHSSSSSSSGRGPLSPRIES